MSNEISPRLAAAVEARRLELGIDPGRFATITGLTRQGLAPIRRGEVRKYQDRLKNAVCDALHWSRNSIDLLLDGGEPITWEFELYDLQAIVHAIGNRLISGDADAGDAQMYLRHRDKVNEARTRMSLEPMETWPEVEAVLSSRSPPSVVPVADRPEDGLPGRVTELESLVADLAERMEEMDVQLRTLQARRATRTLQERS